MSPAHVPHTGFLDASNFLNATICIWIGLDWISIGIRRIPIINHQSSIMSSLISEATLEYIRPSADSKIRNIFSIFPLKTWPCIIQRSWSRESSENEHDLCESLAQYFMHFLHIRLGARTNPLRSAMLAIVVLSPPGITRPARPAKSSGFRTSTTSTPHRLSAA